MALANLQHRFAALSQPLSRKEANGWMDESPYLCLVIRGDHKLMTACEIVFKGCSSTTLVGLRLPDSKNLDDLKTMLKFTKTFELSFGFYFPELKQEDICANLKASTFLQGARLVNCKQHIHVANIML